MPGPESPAPACRLAVVVHRPVPYYVALYRQLAAQADIDLTVLYCSGGERHDEGYGQAVDWGVDLMAGYRSRVFRNWSPWPDRPGFLRYVTPGLLWALLVGGYDAVYAHSLNYATTALALLAARMRGRRVLYRADAYNLGERSGAKRAVRRAVYSRTFRLADRLLYIGTHNRAFYTAFGVPESKLVPVPFVVDNARFAAEADRLAGQTVELKRSFGIPADRRVLLFTGKFQAKKQPVRLVEAFARTRARRDWTLLMVGDGELRPAAEQCATALGLDNVVFAGFLNQNEVGRAYACADVLALPSAYQETWGLVVNEAMNFRCAIVVSDRVGCAPDLVEGICGLVVPHDDIQALADAIDTLAADPALLARYQAAAPERIAQWGLPQAVAGIRAALGLPA